MQGGFLLLEAGMSRAKNSINVAVKNLADIGVSISCFWLVGFAFMFGETLNGLVGKNLFLVNDDSSWLMMFFLFQSMFCATSSTIISGASAERIHFYSYTVIVIIVSTLIYPIFGHWSWGGTFWGDTQGWLSVMGFRDFAGATVVHSLGGWAALAVILILGPRYQRFSDYGKKHGITGSNLPLVTLGVLILWFGWFGFNGGSNLALNENIPGILLRTNISAVFGLITSLLINKIRKEVVSPIRLINGALGGLVAITACCDVVTVREAALIGIIAGLIVSMAEKLLLHLEIDDVVGAVPTHLFCGIWGTLCVALFGDLNTLGTGLNFWQQLGVQILGIVVCFLWAFVFAGILFYLVNNIRRFRVPIEYEIDGLNIKEHKITTEIFDLFRILDKHAQSGDISERVEVEPFTESGQIAKLYNDVIDNLEDRTMSLRNFLNYSGQGFLSFGPDLKVGKESSAACKEIFKLEQIEGKNIADLLYETDLAKDNFKHSMRLIFENKSSPEVVFRLCDDAHFINGKEIHINYQFLNTNRVMIILTDTSEEKKLQEELNKTNEEQQRLLTIISNNKFFTNTMVDAKNLFESLNQLGNLDDLKKLDLKEINSLQLLIHSFKGNLGFFGFFKTISVAHEFETFLIDIEQTNNFKGIVKYGKLLNDTFNRELNYYKEKIGEEWIERFDTLQIPIYKIHSLEAKVKEKYSADDAILKEISSLRKVKASRFLNHFDPHLDSLAQKLGEKNKTPKYRRRRHIGRFSYL